MIASPNLQARGKAPVRLVVIHTAEGALTTAALGRYFAKASAEASSHVGIDDQGIEVYVPYDKASWTLRSGNGISDNAELCGFAKWTRAQWLNEHAPMLRLAAQWIRERCLARGIPIKKLTPAEVAAGKAGVIGHVDWTLGMKDGSHTDPGPGFPWDVVIQLAAGTAPATTAAPATHQGDDLVIPFAWPAGSGRYKLVVPVGKASALVDKAWLSLACDGDLTSFDVWFQGDKGGLTEDHGKAPKDTRRVWDLPDGCTQITLHYEATGPVGATIEVQPR